MRFKKIVGFGDSWMWGDELLDPALASTPGAHSIWDQNTPYREQHCFLGQLGSHYGVPTENFGWPGGSLQSAIWCYIWWMEHETVPLEDCLILACHTDANRQSFYNPMHVNYSNDPPWNRFVQSAWINSGWNTDIGKDWVDMIKLHTVLTDCPQSQKLNFKQSVLFFQGQSVNNSVLQFCSISAPCIMNTPGMLWPGLDLHHIISNNPNRATLTCKDGHPNEQGHAFIKNLLIREIDQL
jgi:hypothetical protein